MYEARPACKVERIKCLNNDQGKGKGTSQNDIMQNMEHIMTKYDMHLHIHFRGLFFMQHGA